MKSAKMLRLKVSQFDKHAPSLWLMQSSYMINIHLTHQMKQALKIQGKIQVKFFCRHNFKRKFGLATHFSIKKITFLGVFGKILSVYTLATENCLEQSFFTMKRKPAFRQNHDYCETIPILSQLLKRLLYVNIRLN